MTTSRSRADASGASTWAPTFRSGAVARLAGMPVATLRIWEQRHRAVRPGTTMSGHRLYSQADVERVLLLRQLTAQGHGIGSIAGLETVQLQALARSHADAGARAAEPATRAASARRKTRASSPLRLAVVGRALADRLLRPTVGLRMPRPFRVVVVFDSLADAARSRRAGPAADLLLWQSPGLPATPPAELRTGLAACQAPRAAVLYRFASVAACRAFADTGAATTREPNEDEALADWLAALDAASDADAGRPLARPARTTTGERTPVTPRRFEDAALTAIAGLPPKLACECPRHIAELLLQLSSF